jgi:hypothetical protein
MGVYRRAEKLAGEPLTAEDRAPAPATSLASVPVPGRSALLRVLRSAAETRLERCRREGEPIDVGAITQHVLDDLQRVIDLRDHLEWLRASLLQVLEQQGRR